jgi:hypothetical protein
LHAAAVIESHNNKSPRFVLRVESWATDHGKRGARAETRSSFIEAVKRSGRQGGSARGPTIGVVRSTGESTLAEVASSLRRAWSFVFRSVFPRFRLTWLMVVPRAVGIAAIQGNSMIMTEEFVARSSALTEARMPSVVSAFVTLAEQSWSKPEVVQAFVLAQKASTTTAACRALLSALQVAQGAYPTAMFWWKNEISEFLGFCSRFAEAAGVRPLDLLGRTDADSAVTWRRQAPLYMRDDREVMLARAPKLDIIERQDRGDTTVWLRTSKVPYDSIRGPGTVGGFDTISAAEAVRLSRKRAARS